ncbi:MAG: hypothetical protein R3237_06055 [Nitrosopumilaceae archaeon]|nr:hypothetical protein [Nitrosopumilaceae archaeon]
MNTHLNPNNESDSVLKVISVLFFVSIVLMLGSMLFEINPFEQKSVFDKPLKLNGVIYDKIAFASIFSENVVIQRR